MFSDSSTKSAFASTQLPFSLPLKLQVATFTSGKFLILLTFPELLNEGYEPHKVREVWVMSREDADHFNSISEESMQIAIRALAAHKSQVSEDGIRWTLERKKEHAKEFDADYVESFKTFVLR